MTLQRLRRHSWAWAGTAGALAVLLALALLGLDRVVHVGPYIPAGNARALLGASFSAIVTIGAFSFWMRPVAAQMASNSLPPRVLAGHMHDDFQRLVVSATVGGLTYVSVVIYSLPPGDGRSPTMATVTGALVAVGGIVALLVAMQRGERSTRPGRVLAATAHVVAADLRALQRGARVPAAEDAELPCSRGETVLAERSGWVQDVAEPSLAAALPEGSVVRIDAGLGSFVVAGWSPLATVWVPGEAARAAAGTILRHVAVGEERGHRLDLPGALVQLVDIVVHAASSGSGSPSTVYEALWHLGAVLHEVIRCELPAQARRFDGDRVVVAARALDHAELVEVAVEHIRRVTADEPAMAIALVRVLRDVRGEAEHLGRDAVVAAIDRQLDRCVDQCRHAGVLEADLRQLELARRGGDGAAMPDDGYRGAEAG